MNEPPVFKPKKTLPESRGTLNLVVIKITYTITMLCKAQGIVQGGPGVDFKERWKSSYCDY
ncbi:hypothetical protein M8C21_022116 [Ambrosia artemisiifolia]|uniref:Uncharacterized protein n=1 Tax=Ambrosia artemisiifolia TaxID=4212 RepID=A0AAD5G2D9_AMBAR|nr:hypothetical protein M8C21_022116 [Ambrosia artemisiifolia]